MIRYVALLGYPGNVGARRSLAAKLQASRSNLLTAKHPMGLTRHDGRSPFVGRVSASPEKVLAV